MVYVVSAKSPPEEEGVSRSDGAAERMAGVVHLIVRKVVERHIERANSGESASTGIHNPLISNSRTIRKMKKG
jgi:hypothetical protein